jgi:hypothetical protein
LARSSRLLAGEAVPAKTAPQPDERLAVLYDLDWDETHALPNGARSWNKRRSYQRCCAALALDAWADIEVLQRGGWIGGLLVAGLSTAGVHDRQPSRLPGSWRPEDSA